MLQLVRILRCKFVLAIALGLLAGLLACCASEPEGADFDKKLTKKEDGLVYRIGGNKPYTGKAYSSHCGRECLPFIDWQGEFKDGKKHGTFVYPAPGQQFFAPGDEHIVRVKFRDGVEVGKEN